VKRAAVVVCAAVLVWACLDGLSSAHDINGSQLTWNREISRLVFDRCASCHRPGGTSFSLMTYRDLQPHAIAVRDAVLSRRMPPWGAVKGFGDFRNDQALTQEQVEMIADWIEGGMLKGNNPRLLPDPPTFAATAAPVLPPGGLTLGGNTTLTAPLTVDGFMPEHIPAGASMQVVAALPDGRIEPLIWFYEYRDADRHPYLLRWPMRLPAGTEIRGIAAPAIIRLIPPGVQ
jgi:mono/diheme cytochrome c family protein